MLIEDLPEGDALPQLFGAATAERDRPIAQMNRVLWPLDFGGREIKAQRFWIAMDEVEDSVSTGVHARDEIRPRHRTLRRDAGGEWAEIALSLELREVGHFALAHESVQ